LIHFEQLTVMQNKIRFILSIVFIFLLATISNSQVWKTRVNWPDDFPRPPKTEKSLFYLQRNLNRNTIMYDLNLKSDGSVDMREPLEVYWKRYSMEDGVRGELSWFQENFAFGYNVATRASEEYSIKLVAYKDRKVNLKKKSGQWIATMKINGKECQLSNIYVYADESGLAPDVQYVDLYGQDLNTGNKEHERFFAP